MTSHCDVEHVPPNDKASSPGDMTSRRSLETDKETSLKPRKGIYIYGKTIKVDAVNVLAIYLAESELP